MLEAWMLSFPTTNLSICALIDTLSADGRLSQQNAHGSKNWGQTDAEQGTPAPWNHPAAALHSQDVFCWHW
jgi:hypothetical protein